MGRFNQRPPVWYEYDYATKNVVGDIVPSGTTEWDFPLADVPVDETWMIERVFVHTGNTEKVPSTMFAITINQPANDNYLAHAVDYVAAPIAQSFGYSPAILVPSTSSIRALFLMNDPIPADWRLSVRMQYQILKRSS